MKRVMILLLLVLMASVPVHAGPATFDDLTAYGPVDAERVSLLLNETYLKALDAVAPRGIESWLSRERERTRGNIQRARAAGASAVSANPRLVASARRFVAAYAAEQIQLARTFPRSPSEIEPYAGERNGWDLPDRHLVLTFDDGPRPQTTRVVLAALRAHSAPAAFFVLGGKVAADGRAVDYSGFIVGSHTWSHLYMPEASIDKLQSEIERTRAAIAKAGIKASPYFRAPYGARRPRELALLAKFGLRSVLWNIDSQDWQASMQGVHDRIANRIIALALLRRRGIVLCHDIVPATADMLNGLLTRLSALGFHFDAL